MSTLLVHALRKIVCVRGRSGVLWGYGNLGQVVVWLYGKVAPESMRWYVLLAVRQLPRGVQNHVSCFAVALH